MGLGLGTLHPGTFCDPLWDPHDYLAKFNNSYFRFRSSRLNGLFIELQEAERMLPRTKVVNKIDVQGYPPNKS